MIFELFDMIIMSLSEGTRLRAPTISLMQVFQELKAMQKDNLSDPPADKEQGGEEQVRGLKFIAKKLKVLLEKNRRIEYHEASRILISNFAVQQKDERNIKRRVYDAINVLVAASVVIKNQSQIELLSNGKRGREERAIQSKGDAVKRLKIKKQQLAMLKQKKSLLSNILAAINKSNRPQSENKELFVVECCRQNVRVKTKHNSKRTVVSLGKASLRGPPKTLIKFLQAL